MSIEFDPFSTAINFHEGFKLVSDLTLCVLLRAMGVELEPARVKLVRHQDARYDIPYLLSCGQFEVYQANQGRPIFRDCDHIIAFSADGGSRSEFLGLYQVAGVVVEPNRQWPVNFPYYPAPTARSALL